MTTFAPNFRFNELEQNIIDLVNATSSFIYQKTGKKIKDYFQMMNNY